LFEINLAKIDSEPAGRGGRLHQGQKRKQYRKVLDDDEDYVPPFLKRRGSVHTPKTKSGTGKKGRATLMSTIQLKKVAELSFSIH